MIFTVFLVGGLFFFIKDSNASVSNEKEVKENMIICNDNKENRGTIESEEQNVIEDSNKGIVTSEDKRVDDNTEGEIKILPNPDMDNMDIETLPVPDDMESTYLELNKSSESSEKER